VDDGRSQMGDGESGLGNLATANGKCWPALMGRRLSFALTGLDGYSFPFPGLCPGLSYFRPVGAGGIREREGEGERWLLEDGRSQMGDGELKDWGLRTKKTSPRA